MDVIALTRQLVDIPSISDEEEAVGELIYELVRGLAVRYDGAAEKIEVAQNRFNVFAAWGTPYVTFSTHMDTVPPFFPSAEDEVFITGRGACDAKGILACMLVALEGLLAEGYRNLGILAVVGEEKGGQGAKRASEDKRSCKFLINGEPTENKLALGTKGALRLELRAAGTMAHSAYPELGDSAIDKLLDALEKVRQIQLPSDPVLGESTLNIGQISGGRAPNVISDEAVAQLLIRLVDDGESTRKAVGQVCEGLVKVEELLAIPAKHLGTVPGFETTSVAYTTDIPVFGPNWGTPFLLGPGSIHVAHTDHERVPKSDLLRAVHLYRDMARQLLGDKSS